MKLLLITKEVDELTRFEKLFLLDRIWKDLSQAMDGLILTCTSDEEIMSEVMSHSDEGEGELENESSEGKWTSTNAFDNVTFITSKKDGNKLN